MGKRFQYLYDQKVVDQLQKEVISLQFTIGLLKIEYVGLKNQLNTKVVLFQTTLVEKSRKVVVLESTTRTFFQNLAEEFEGKEDLVDDLEEEVKTLSKIENSTENARRISNKRGQKKPRWEG